MKTINHILIKLSNQTIGHTYQRLKSGIYVDYTFNPQEWVPSYGEVVESCTEELQKGDMAYVDYYSVLMALGVRYNTAQKSLADKKYVEENGEISVFLSPKSVFFVMRGKDLIPVNDNVLIAPEEAEQSSVLKTNKKPINICNVLTGEHKGKRMVFRRARMRNCGQMGFNTKEFYVVHKDYLLAEVE